jgi:hypothetical protein
MKLCPQCDFIYEDEQRFCDMDGKALVSDLAPVAIEPRVASPTRLTINLPARSRSRRFPVLLMGGIVLATLLAGFYCVQRQLARSTDGAQSSVQSPVTEQLSTARQETSPNPVSSTSIADTAESARSPEQLPGQSSEESLSPPTDVALEAATSLSQLSQSRSSAASITRARLTYSSVAAGGPSGNSRGPVIVRLSNGALIKADEAWERREGIWYRQAGMVTFLKRSRVKTIERLASPQPPPKSAAGKIQQSSPKSEDMTAQNRLRIRQLETANPKKQSRVSSFLKKTGRILTKPFKF